MRKKQIGGSPHVAAKTQTTMIGTGTPPTRAAGYTSLISATDTMMPIIAETGTAFNTVA